MNYQNIPRSDKVIKRAFVPKLDALIFCDYQQIELRLLAYYMSELGDPSMADVIKAGEDLHTQSAIGALQLTRPPTDEERQVGKTLNFSIVYGGGCPTLMRQLGITYQEARGILDAYHARWPGIALVQHTINTRLEERGYITTLWGRHLHPESEHKALNALVQGCAADLMKSALCKVHFGLGGQAWLPEGDANSPWQPVPMMLPADTTRAHLVSVIHDELIIDSPLDQVAELAESVPAWMIDERVNAVVPIGVDVEWTTTNWAEKRAYERSELVA